MAKSKNKSKIAKIPDARYITALGAILLRTKLCQTGTFEIYLKIISVIKL